MMALSLHGYQRDLVAAVTASWRDGLYRPAAVLPTGGGKTVSASAIIAEEHESGRVGRTLVIAHRPELIKQWVGTLRLMAPRLRVGVVAAGDDQTGADVVVGMVQTLRTERRRNRIRNVGLVVVDECHHAAAQSYQDCLRHWGCLDGTLSPAGTRARALGLTATMSRGDGVALGQTWEQVVYRRPIAHMIRDGFLVEPRGLRVRIEDLDLRKVRKRPDGDYRDSALGEAMSASLVAPGRIYDAWAEHASDRLTIGFAPTVDFARTMTETFAEHGVATAMVWGEQAKEERALVLKRFAAGEIRVVWNCGVMTEGTDIPPVSCIIVSRPTLHQGLYIQMVGRGLRLYPGKSDCLVMDVSGVTGRHALATEVDLVGTEDMERVGESDELDVLSMLTEDLAEAGEKPEPDELVYRDGRVVTEEVDLFHGSRLTWYQTEAGLWFLPVGNRYLSIVPEREGVGVAVRESFAGGRAWWVARGLLDVTMAMSTAEDDVSEGEREVAARDARYRTKTPNALELKSWQKLNPGASTPRTVSELRRAQVVRDASRALDPGYLHWLASQQLVK